MLCAFSSGESAGQLSSCTMVNKVLLFTDEQWAKVSERLHPCGESGWP